MGIEIKFCLVDDVFSANSEELFLENLGRKKHVKCINIIKLNERIQITFFVLYSRKQYRLTITIQYSVFKDKKRLKSQFSTLGF